MVDLKSGTKKVKAKFRYGGKVEGRGADIILPIVMQFSIPGSKSEMPRALIGEISKADSVSGIEDIILYDRGVDFRHLEFISR